MSALKVYSPDFLLSLTSLRDGETKAGQKFQTLSGNDLSLIAKSTAKFVLFGIPEDIGVRANFGIAGASEMWETALKKLCNVQHNDYFDAANILVFGEIEVDDFMKQAENAPDEKLRELTAEMDERVAPVIESIVKAGKEAIVIGG